MINEKLEVLVKIFDLRNVEIVLDVPKNLAGTKILQSTIEKYMPSLASRTATTAWTLLFAVYKQKFSEGTYETFTNNFMCSAVGNEAFQETLAHVATKIKQNITVEDLKPLIEEANQKQKEPNAEGS